MGKAKASGKGGGSSSKPDHMTDDEWTLYNNVAELVMVRDIHPGQARGG
jgi:hypothetical protein